MKNSLIYHCYPFLSAAQLSTGHLSLMKEWIHEDDEIGSSTNMKKVYYSYLKHILAVY